jgi:hypothetical protein
MNIYKFVVPEDSVGMAGVTRSWTRVFGRLHDARAQQGTNPPAGEGGTSFALWHLML